MKMLFEERRISGFDHTPILPKVSQLLPTVIIGRKPGKPSLVELSPRSEASFDTGHHEPYG